MILVAELDKPYTEKDRIYFLLEYERKRGLKIKESTTSIQAYDLSEEEKKEIEYKDIAMLNLTGADVERGIYKATGMDFDDILKMVEKLSTTILNEETGEIIQQGLNIDIKALKIEFKANNFYRGNPYVDQIGELLGFTKEQLDDFFKTNDYTKLLSISNESVDNNI